MVSHNESILRELAEQPAPHDLLVEGLAASAPTAAEVVAVLRGLDAGTEDVVVVAAWAEAQLSQHLFPPADEDDSLARIGEALMQLSMLERLPMTAPQRAALTKLVRGEEGWEGWMVALGQ
ncbi:MAG: hypothetical protein ACI8S6_001263 [Myxococcota bacterium]|jgi:hypothetical protein